MHVKQANCYLASKGYPDLFVNKAEGIWYLLGDEGVVHQDVERCLHVCRLSDLTSEVLDWKLKELTA